VRRASCRAAMLQCVGEAGGEWARARGRLRAMRGRTAQTMRRGDVGNGAMCRTNRAPRKTTLSRRILDAVGAAQCQKPTEHRCTNKSKRATTEKNPDTFAAESPSRSPDDRGLPQLSVRKSSRNHRLIRNYRSDAALSRRSESRGTPESWPVPSVAADCRTSGTNRVGARERSCKCAADRWQPTHHSTSERAT